MVHTKRQTESQTYILLLYYKETMLFWIFAVLKEHPILKIILWKKTNWKIVDLLLYNFIGGIFMY